MQSILTKLLVVLLLTSSCCLADLQSDALQAARHATSFLTDQVATEGGYLWRYSDDLKHREGEGVVTTRTVWVQPPGTPSVGEAFVRLFNATGEEQFLQAARSAGEVLRLGQMRSGGWQAMVELEPERRKKWAYRVDAPVPKARDQSSLDDDKTQSALRFIMQLDRALDFQDQAVHEMARYGLDGLLGKGQLPGGGFPQVWTSTRQLPEDHSFSAASFPESWPRQYPGHREYWHRYTLNDNLAPDVLETLFLAESIYGEDRFRQAALRLGDFLLAAQLPEPQPGWAQQYSFEMHPIWARKFEPPAITGGESQGVIETLLELFQRTGEPKFLEPIPRALDYFERSKLSDGKLARFYELRTNRPLYFTRNYELTYDDGDVPTHYSFKTPSRLDRLRARFQRLSEAGAQQAQAPVRQQRRPSEQAIREVIEALDRRGAWVTEAGLRYHKRPGPVIDMQVAVRHLNLLAAYLASVGD